MAPGGYVKLWRILQHHPLWQEPRRFSRAEAFLDCVMSARHKGDIVRWHGMRVRVPRGSFPATTLGLARRWGWTRKTVRCFLNGNNGVSSRPLKGYTQGANERANAGTIVTVDNYDRYQGEGPTGYPAEGPPKGPTTTQEVKKEASCTDCGQPVDNSPKRIHEVAAVYEVFRNASGNLIRPPTPADKQVISRAIDDLDGDWRAVAATVQDVCLKAVKAGSKPRTVAYCRPALEEKARERREAAVSSDPRVKAMLDGVTAKMGTAEPEHLLPDDVRNPKLTPQERATLKRLKESVRR